MIKKTPCKKVLKKDINITLDTILGVLTEIEARLLSLEKKAPVINVYPPTQLQPNLTPPGSPVYPKPYPGPWCGPGGGSGGNGNVHRDPNVVYYGDATNLCGKHPFKNIANEQPGAFDNISHS